MSEKRQPEERQTPEEKRQRRDSLRSVIIEATKNHAFQKLLSALEPLFRKIVKEEVEEALAKHLTSKKRFCGNQIHPSSSRTLQLQFTNKLSLPVFTGAKIEGEDSLPINIALVDELTGVVVRDGAESSMGVEIVVLEGDFDSDEKEGWSFEDFNEYVVRAREGKRPLLAGDSFFTLNYGTGVIGELAFTDNSSWTRSRKFRLGARVVGGFFDGVRIKEARTESFVVKDHRGELYKKHYPPSLADEVWRLEKIGKDGAFHRRLCRENIITVKDFLTLLCLDSQRLRNILGSGMSAKMWEVTVEHARTCVLNSQIYAYYPNAQKMTGVLFNVIGELMSLIVEQQCLSPKELSETQKADAQKLVTDAYQHWEEVILLTEGAGSCNSGLPSVPFYSDGYCYLSDYSSYRQSGGYNFVQQAGSPLDLMPSMLSTEGVRSCEEYSLPPLHSMDFRDDPDLHGLLNGGGSSMAEEHLQYFDTDSISSSVNPGLESQADLTAAVSGFLALSAKEAAHSKWRTLRAVLRWRFSIRRIIKKTRNI